jgi:hypothetical protein
MTAYGKIPFQSVEFDANGQPKSQIPTVPEVTDLIVISHGWNNDADEATGLYKTLLTNLSTALETAGAPQLGRTFSSVGVYWPSKQFDFDGRGEAPTGIGPKNAVGAASIADGGNVPDVEHALAQLSSLYDKNNPQLIEIQKLVADRNNSANGSKLVEALRNLVKPVDTSALDASLQFYQQDKTTVYTKATQSLPQSNLNSPVAQQREVEAAGIKNLVNSIENGFANLLNVGTYYTMKGRASTVGKIGVALCLDKWSTSANLKRIHLIGHSFGARLVTAAAMASQTEKLSTLILLQAAFSHNGFATGKLTGYFRSVVEKKRVTGPTIVTFSKYDSAVGKAYAIASRLSGTNAESFGGPDDEFGGLGANGALHMKHGESTTAPMVAHGQPYSLQAKIFNNLESSEYIKSHGDVSNPNVAWAIGSGIVSAP